MDGGELYDAIVATNVELQRLLVKTVEIISVNHPCATSHDPGVAFSEILSRSIPKLKEATEPFAAGKLFLSSKRDKLLPRIDINALDNSLLLDILLKVDDFLQICRNAGACSFQQHKIVCCDECNTKCDHSSLFCKKCRSNGGRPSTKCKHQCKHCTKTEKQCAEDAVLCCGKCKICVMCNSSHSSAQIEAWIKTTPLAYPPPCSFYMFLCCLKILLKWRNLFAHTTTKVLQKFINGSSLSTFEPCKNPKELFELIKSVFMYVLDYISNPTISKDPLKNDDHKEFANSLSCILTFGKTLRKYLLDNYQQVRDQFQSSTKFFGKLEQFQDRMITYLQSQFGELKALMDTNSRNQQEIKDQLENFTKQLKLLNKKSPASFNFTISITKNQLKEKKETVCKDDEEEDQTDLFNEDDIDVEGELRSIFHDSCLLAIEDVLQLKHEKDYHIIDVDCSFPEKMPKDVVLKSYIEFKLTLNDTEPFPKKLCYEKSTEAIELRKKLKAAVQDAVQAEYDMPVKVGFKRWGFGSLILEGFIFLHTTADSILQKGILEIIKSEAGKIYREASIERLQSKHCDCSVVKFSIEVLPAHPIMSRRIHEKILLLESSFIKHAADQWIKGGRLGKKSKANICWETMLLEYCNHFVIEQYRKSNAETKKTFLKGLESSTLPRFVNLKTCFYFTRGIDLGVVIKPDEINKSDRTLMKALGQSKSDINASLLAEIKSFLKQWGLPKSREEEIPEALSKIKENRRNKTLEYPVINTHVAAVKKDDHICLLDFAKLKKTYIQDLKLFSVAKGQYIECKTFIPPNANQRNIITYIEDEKGGYAQLGLYNCIPHNLNNWEYVDRMFPKGTKLKIAEPLYKIFSDGRIGIRVDSLNEISKVENLQDYEEIRQQGKTLVEAGDLVGALKVYMDGIVQYENVATLLNNRTQTELKLLQYEEALLDAAAALLLQPKNEKARLRYNSILQHMDYKKGSKLKNWSVWKKALLKHDVIVAQDNVEIGNKEKGNAAYKVGNYDEAKKQYSTALNNNADEICILLNNISVVCVKLQIYQTSISAASASLRISKMYQKKARYNITKAFSMLGELQLAMISANNDLSLAYFWDGNRHPEIIARHLIKERFQDCRAQGIDESSIVDKWDKINDVTKNSEIPGDFLQPNTIEHCYIECKGRGLKAKREIQQDEIILIDHPICSPFVKGPTSSSEAVDEIASFYLDDSKKISLSKSTLSLEKHILSLIVFDGLLAKKILLLETKKFEFITEVTEESTELPLVDLDWMAYRKLCHHIPPFLPQTPEEVGVDIGRLTDSFVNDVIANNSIQHRSRPALFLRLSLVNHDMDANCICLQIADCKLFIAVKDIPEGEELTMTYSENPKVLANWGLS